MVLMSFNYVKIEFRYKLDIDFYVLVKVKMVVYVFEVSVDGEKFSIIGLDRRVRVFRWKIGKLIKDIDEFLEGVEDV